MLQQTIQKLILQSLNVNAKTMMICMPVADEIIFYMKEFFVLQIICAFP